jgi:subtilisin family serine protease
VKRITSLLLAGMVALAACADQEPTGLAPMSHESAAPSLNVAGSEAPQFVPGQVLVRFRPGAARSEIAEANRARPREELLMERVWILEVEPGEEIEIANNLARNPNVEFAEPNFVYSVIPCGTGDCTAPSDAVFGLKWDLHNPGFLTDAAGNQVAETGAKGADIAWLEAFEYLRNSDITPSTTVIGIVDTGIRATHQDLAGKVIGGRNFCPSFLCLIGTVNAGAWADDNGHGTHVAGIAAARAGDGLGVPGVAYLDEVKLLAVKVCGGPLGTCNAAGIANGIRWAADNGAHVLNLSLGGGAPSAATQSALQYALGKNVLPVCAAGNDGTGTVAYPGAFPECMAVSSTGWGDALASYSQFGPEIEVSAPGGDLGDSAPYSYILSAYHSANDAYAFMAGTSMAAPQVSGLAALLRATGMSSVSDIRARIRATADDRGPTGWDQRFGDGRINVYRAVTGMDPFIAMTGSTRSTVASRALGNMQAVLLNREAVTYSLTDIRVETIRIGSTPLATRPNGTLFATWSDVDGDGHPDLVLHFAVPSLLANGDLSSGTTQVTLHASLQDGRRLRASLPVTVR